MTEHTPVPWEYERGFRDAGNKPGDHYTVDDDFITVYMGEEAINDFDPEKHDWVEVYGPNQEANACFIVTACNCHADLLKALNLLLSHPSDNPADAVKTNDGYFLSPLNIAEREARSLIRKAEEQMR